MVRTVFIVFVLAALYATPSQAATIAVSRPARTAKPHGHGHAATAAHSGSHARTAHATTPAPHRPGSHSRAHVAAVHTPSRAPSSHAHPRHLAEPAHHAEEPAHRAPVPHPYEPLPPPAEPTEEGVSLHRRAPSPMPMPPPLRGSLESLERQNEINDAEGLERILDDDDLNDRIEHKMLVPVPTSAALTINANLPDNRRYCRPWTARFLTDLARAHAARFEQPLEVSSAVRTVEYQKQLMLINGNAAAAEGDIVSPHVTGATVDIAKGTMTRQELGWTRNWLLKLQLERKIDVEEEFQQACFHITVYKNYVPPPAPPVKRHPRRTPSIERGVQVASSGE